ncbi:MAG: FUSC family protein [Actinobacteria bacterium]|nr:FUSC family protein [Actinomycetota bacterium]
MSEVWAGWTVPRAALALSAVATVVVVASVVAGYLLGGVPAALCIGLGFMTAQRPALYLRPAHALGLIVPTVMAGVVAVALRGQPLAAACFVALCCLLVAPAGMLSDGLLSVLPTSVAVLVLVPGDVEPGPTALWLLVGAVLMVAMAARLPRRPRAPGIEQRRAWRHAIVMALSAGLVVYLVGVWDVPHGYWVALTLTVVLRPFDDQTMTRASERVLGTIAGALLALVAALLLPLPALLVLLMGCTVLSFAYAMKGDYVRQVLFLTPSVVLIGSAGGNAALLASERALATLAGALLAAGIALALARFDTHRRVEVS